MGLGHVLSIFHLNLLTDGFIRQKSGFAGQLALYSTIDKIPLQIKNTWRK
jgi:hypothetical protein